MLMAPLEPWDLCEVQSVTLRPRVRTHTMDSWLLDRPPAIARCCGCDTLCDTHSDSLHGTLTRGCPERDRIARPSTS